ncbi:MAG: hypothetical protein KatS3mg059_1634 [Thermomicrobiales bacterium]|nr:MAG: hypothetical protein KatS3mg059_1634 [Thermomicrobiales bacterium]
MTDRERLAVAKELTCTKALMVSAGLRKTNRGGGGLSLVTAAARA